MRSTDLKWAACNAVAACAHVMFARYGTVTSGGPSEHHDRDGRPLLGDTPGLGFCDTMSPDPTVIDLTGAPCARCMCTLVTAVLAWATVRFVIVGVGCEGVNTLVPKATASPAASSTTAAASPR